MNFFFYNNGMTGLQIFIRHIDGRMTGIEVPLDTKVEDLYERLQGVICDISRLSFGGTTLNDMKELLADIGVTQEAVINEVKQPHLRIIDLWTNHRALEEVVSYGSDGSSLFVCIDLEDLFKVKYVSFNLEEVVIDDIGSLIYITQVNEHPMDSEKDADIEIIIPKSDILSIKFNKPLGVGIIFLNEKYDLKDIMINFHCDDLDIRQAFNPKKSIPNAIFKEDVADTHYERTWSITELV